MKSTLKILMLSMLLMSGTLYSHAAFDGKGKAVKAKAANMTDAQKQARLEEIKARAEEMRDMDKSTLSRAERKELRKEARDLRREARTMSGGVYLSIGAIIIIILLLILIL
ncbi:MAG: hypothetical protein NVV59_03585 [Chitinophagaceae bacterium]|nr:hypothetical protein [Chitinophagaceae bacterium]